MVPVVVILPIREPFPSVIHKLPSPPVVIILALYQSLGREYSVGLPKVVILPTTLLGQLVNHRLPSGPAVIACGIDVVVYSVIVPSVVIVPMALLFESVNQRLLSGPAVMLIIPLPTELLS